MGRLSSLLIGVISGASAAYYLSTEQGKKVTKKVVRFVKDYQEDPQEVHESVKQTAKDVSKQAAEVIQQTKEKVGSGEITTGTVLESVKEKTQDVVEKSQEVYHSFKDKLQKENLSGNDLVQSIRKQTEYRAMAHLSIWIKTANQIVCTCVGVDGFEPPTLCL